MSQLAIIDIDTGEVLPATRDNIKKLSSTTKWSPPAKASDVTPKQYKAKQKPRLSRISKGSYIYMTVYDTQLFMPEVPPADVARLVRLVLRVDWRGKLPQSMLDVDFVQKELGVVQVTAYKFLQFLRTNYGNTVETIEDNLEDVFFKGSPNAYKDMDNGARGVKVFASGYLDAYSYSGQYDRTALGCLLQLAPYINRSTNILCCNVNRCGMNRSNPIGVDELAEILSMKPKYFRERIFPAWKKILINTNGDLQPIVKNIGGAFVVNPALMTATKYDAPVWEYFLNKKFNKEDY